MTPGYAWLAGLAALMKKLKTLDVHGSKVTDLSPVKELPKLHIVQSR